MQNDDISISAEKPLIGRRFDVNNVGNAEDTSLFGLIVRQWPNLNHGGEPKGWLVCDDGAMESADFVHFDNTLDPPELTLIHAKGSSSGNLDREISVADYEVVVGQAVKNLRYTDRVHISEKLRTTGGGVLKDAVWYRGVRQNNRDGVIQALTDAGSNMKKKVVVLQPRVRRTRYEAIREQFENGEGVNREMCRLQQLDALLLGARSDCYALGADFEVIADGVPNP